MFAQYFVKKNLLPVIIPEAKFCFEKVLMVPLFSAFIKDAFKIEASNESLKLEPFLWCHLGILRGKLSSLNQCLE